MSKEKNSSLLGSALHGAVALLGIVVAVWIAAKLLLEVWWVLLVAMAVGLATWIVVRLIQRKDRW